MHRRDARLSVCLRLAIALASVMQPARPIAAKTAPLGLVAEAPAEGRAIKTEQGYMVAYKETIPGTEIEFAMVPVPEGEVLLGSPETEPERDASEGPQLRVRVEPMWVGRCEVTWAEYRAYMAMYRAFKDLQRYALAANEADNEADNEVDEGGDKGADEGEDDEVQRLIARHALTGGVTEELHVDAVTSPTPLYDASYTYSAGEAPDRPAVTMTHYAARQYTKWLSRTTGRAYRLPTESEWEYFARAGTTTSWSFGDDPAQLGEFAWYDENSDYETHAVGGKQPNPWGLYDVHGNVGEWTLDEYRSDAYQRLSEASGHAGVLSVLQAVQWPAKVFPRTIRGGSWLDVPSATRSASRYPSEEKEWKLSDPNSPLSPWWYTEEPAMGVGMRVVRSLVPLDDATRRRVWELDNERVSEDVNDRLLEGRGVMGVADPELPAAIEALAN